MSQKEEILQFEEEKNEKLTKNKKIAKQNKIFKFLLLFLCSIIFILLIVVINLSKELSEIKLEDREEFFDQGMALEEIPAFPLSDIYEPQSLTLPSFGRTTITPGLIINSDEIGRIIIDNNEEIQNQIPINFIDIILQEQQRLEQYPQLKEKYPIEKYPILYEKQIIEKYPLLKEEIKAYFTIKAKEAAKKIPRRLKNEDGNLDLRQFNKKVKGKNAYQEKKGWTIEKDYSQHGGSKYKLKNKFGERVASIGENGKILRK